MSRRGLVTGKALRRRKPKGGQMSLRAISAELAARGHVNERGKPFNPNSIAAMLGGCHEGSGKVADPHCRGGAGEGPEVLLEAMISSDPAIDGASPRRRLEGGGAAVDAFASLGRRLVLLRVKRSIRAVIGGPRPRRDKPPASLTYWGNSGLRRLPVCTR